MREKYCAPREVLFAVCVILIAFSCKKKDDSITNPSGNNNLYDYTNDTVDVDSIGMPKFVKNDYIALDSIGYISRFRSAIGHDYSDDFESCRSMKHYFQPKDTVAWANVKIYSPVDGVVLNVYPEWAGNKYLLRAKKYPAFFFEIFHVNPVIMLQVGDTVFAGEYIGNHVGEQTYSDIAVRVQTPAGMKLVSYFSIMTDTLFNHYKNRGVQNRDAFIISKQARDADTLRCNGETFQNSGTLSNWVTLF
ncbi:MAG: hypothetical protein AAB071_03300 [Bacteroidota bacterium]